MKTLILGGVKSGKSREAECIATASQLPVTLIATALAGDDEMTQRINRHKQQRPDTWQVIEAPYALSDALSKLSAQTSAQNKNTAVIIDCLTLWLTQLLCTKNNPDKIAVEIDLLINTIKSFEGVLIVVSNESGLGITPTGELSRSYLDYLGVLHQRIAKLADNVTLMVAGLPVKVK